MDVELFQGPNGGEITFTGGLVKMSDGLASACYLSMFGGNELDSGEEATDSQSWWGNLGEPDEAKQYRSRTQYVLRALPAVSANLLKLEDAMQADLAWLTDEIATGIEATANLTAPRRVHLSVTVHVGESTYGPFEFDASWGAP